MSVFEDSVAYRPFKYPFAVEAAKKHAIDMFWDVHQIDLLDDLRQYNSPTGLATPNVTHEVNKQILDKILCLFTELDKTVAEGYTKLLPHIKNNEIRNMLMTFAAREVVHQRAYALAAEAFGFSDDDWKAFSKYVEMQAKIEVMSHDEDLTSKLGCAKLLARILLGEGVGLFAAFACLLNFKRQGLLMGFNDVNQWSLADEQEHVSNNIRVLKLMMKDLTSWERVALQQHISKLADEYMKAEFMFINLLGEIGEQQDLTREELMRYIDYLRCLRLYELEILDLQFVPENPLPWMEWMLTGKKHDNFFEKRVTEYSHEGLSGKVDYTKYVK